MRSIATCFILSLCAVATGAFAQDGTPSRAEVMKLFKLDAGNARMPEGGGEQSLYFLRCHGMWGKIDSVQISIFQGDERKASKDAAEYTKDKAACAWAEMKAGASDEVAAGYATNVGMLLGYSLPLKSGDSEVQAKKRVVAYLEFAKAHGDIVASAYLEQFRRAGDFPSMLAGKPVQYSFAAADVTKMAKGNLLAFNKKYSGTVMEVTGTLDSIYQSGSEQILEIQDVKCYVVDAKEKQKLDNIFPHMSIKVRGGYFGVWEGSSGLHKYDFVLAACTIDTTSAAAPGLPKQPE